MLSLVPFEIMVSQNYEKNMLYVFNPIPKKEFASSNRHKSVRIDLDRFDEKNVLFCIEFDVKLNSFRRFGKPMAANRIMVSGAHFGRGK